MILESNDFLRISNREACFLCMQKTETRVLPAQREAFLLCVQDTEACAGRAAGRFAESLVLLVLIHP